MRLTRGQALARLLSGGDRRSTGQVPAVVRAAARDPSIVGELVRLLDADDPVVRMRAADALEKATRLDPSPLRLHRERLFRLARGASQQEVRWHLAQLLPRLPLDTAWRDRALGILRRYLHDASAIVRTFALQGMFDLTAGDPRRRARVGHALRTAMRSGSPAVRARARRLLTAGASG